MKLSIFYFERTLKRKKVNTKKSFVPSASKNLGYSAKIGVEMKNNHDSLFFLKIYYKYSSFKREVM